MDVSVAVHLHLEAPADCADAPSFLERVRARAPRVQIADDHEEAPTYRVRVEQARGRVLGSVAIDDGEVRSIAGASYRDVVDGLALTVALSIDARSPASTSPPSGPAEAQSPLPDPSAPPSATARPEAERAPSSGRRDGSGRDRHG